MRNGINIIDSNKIPTKVESCVIVQMSEVSAAGGGWTSADKVLKCDRKMELFICTLYIQYFSQIFSTYRKLLPQLTCDILCNVANRILLRKFGRFPPYYLKITSSHQNCSSFEQEVGFLFLLGGQCLFDRPGRVHPSGQFALSRQIWAVVCQSRLRRGWTILTTVYSIHSEIAQDIHTAETRIIFGPAYNG